MYVYIYTYLYILDTHLKICVFVHIHIYICMYIGVFLLDRGSSHRRLRQLQALQVLPVPGAALPGPRPRASRA